MQSFSSACTEIKSKLNKSTNTNIVFFTIFYTEEREGVFINVFMLCMCIARMQKGISPFCTNGKTIPFCVASKHGSTRKTNKEQFPIRFCLEETVRTSNAHTMVSDGNF